MPFPNDETKFKPGESGNPAGKPKGSKNLSTILREMLNEEIEVVIDGVKQKKTFADTIVRKLLKKAHDGDVRAIIETFDRTEGKSQQSIDMTTGGEKIAFSGIQIIKPNDPDPEVRP